MASVSQQRPTRLVFPLLIAVAIIFSIVAPLFALIWANQPFLGTFLYPRLVVADSYVPASWQGHENAQILLNLNNTPVTSGRDLFNLLRQQQIGDAVTLQLQSATASSLEANRPVAVTLIALPWTDMFIFFWLPYGIGLIYLVLGFVVYHLRSGERVSGVFVSFCILFAILAGGMFDQYTFHLLTPLWVFALPLTSAALIHLAMVFPAETRLIRRRPWAGLLPYLVALLLGVANLYGIYLAPTAQTYLNLQVGNFAFSGLAVLLFLFLLLDARFFALSTPIRQQITVIFWGSVISFGPTAVWIGANLFGLTIPLSGSIFIAVFAPMIIFPITISYAILRYRLLDLDIIFSRGITYTLLLALVAVVYFGLVTLLGTLLQDTAIFRNPVILVLFILALLIFLEPMKQRLQDWINRLFKLETFDSRQVLELYGRTLIATPLDTDSILRLLLDQVQTALAPERALVFLRNPTNNSFTIRQQEGVGALQAVEVRFGPNDDLAHWLGKTGRLLQLSPGGNFTANAGVAPEELARLRMLNIILCVPLPGSARLLGWLALGLKQAGHPYTSSDLIFLTTLANQTTIALENAQHLEQANQRAAELEALQKISLDIQAEVEPDQLLTSVVEQATRLLQAEGGMAFLLEPDNETLKVVVSHNLDQDYRGYRLKTDEDIAGQVIKQGRPVLVDNHQNFAGRSATFHEARFGAVMGVPLRWRERVRGILYLVHRPHGLRFNEDNVRLMEFFATQSAIALEKSQLLQEARARANQLATLMDVSAAISATLDLDVALQRVMDRAVQILNAEAGSLLLMDRYGKELTFEVVLGPSGADLQGVKTKVGTGIVGTVAQSGQPLIVNNVRTDPRFNIAFDEATEFHTRDILCVPMITREQVVGVIEVINKNDGTVFSQEDQNLLLSFGAQAAIAIENAQRFTRTDQALAERVQELQALQMFDKELQTSLELGRVLDILLTHAMDALGLSMGVAGVVDEAEGIYLLAQHGMPMEMGRYKRDPWPLTKGVLGRVARTGELAWANDITQEKDYVPKNHQTRSLLVIPVLREGRVIAVLDLESTDPDYFTSDDVAFVRALASHTAIAVENAQLFEKVKEANEAKSEFMSTASHELKIPMTSIKGFAKLMQMGAGGDLSEQQQNFLNVIANNVDRMAQLVNDLLDVSRIEAGRIRLELRDVQITQVIHEVVEDVQNQIESKQLSLKLNLADNLPEMRADYGRMVQIVTNLVSNAYKYTPAGGQITITAKPYNGDVQGISVTVQDTGYGISEEDQLKLFTTFFRSADDRVREEPGTGLGLAITKKMIESHGGELTFKSTLGQGSAFTFMMPLLCKIPPGVEVTER